MPPINEGNATDVDLETVGRWEIPWISRLLMAHKSPQTTAAFMKTKVHRIFNLGVYELLIVHPSVTFPFSSLSVPVYDFLGS